MKATIATHTDEGPKIEFEQIDTSVLPPLKTKGLPIRKQESLTQLTARILRLWQVIKKYVSR